MAGNGSAVQAVDLLGILNKRRSASAKEQRSCSISAAQDHEQPPTLVKPVPSNVLEDQDEEEEEEEEEEKKKAVEQQLLLSSSNSQAPTAAARNSMMVQQQDDAASETSSHTAEDRHLHEEAAERVDDHDSPDHEPSEDHTPLQQLSVLIPHNIIHEEQLPLQPAAANDQPASSSCTTAAAAAGFAPHQVGGGAVVQVLPPTAQLTIFYAGVVHAYDDVPLDKLQAIMLLAGSRNTKSSSYTNLPGSRGASATATTAHPFLAPIIIPQATRIPSSSVPSTAHTTAVTTAPTTTARPSSSASPGILTRPIARNVHTITELPQARKASLARFLEKRKDRVRTKAPYPLTFAIKKEGPSTPWRDKSPSPPQRQPQTRSPSPAALLAGSSHQSAVMPSSTNSRDPLQYYKSSDTSSEPNSPTRSPPTPPRLSTASGYVVNTTAGSCSAAAGVKDFERRQQLVNSIPHYQSEKSSPLQKSSGDEKGEEASMEEEDGTS
ncbi:unnamed protein product [Sphagnum tenellum]